MAGIYVHIPFCSSFCIYCGFYSELNVARMDAFAGALAAEARSRKDFFDKGVLPSTLYFGGGTPSLLPPDCLEEVVESIRKSFGVSGFEEFTLEANPDDVNPEKLALWRSLGVNRLSLGVQSFNDSHLRWMCRRHDAAGAENAFRAAREAGFDNISIDLIFGYAGLTYAGWRESIERALDLRPEHISCYQMSVEEGSTLGRLASLGRYAEPSQELCASQYALLQGMLRAAGYRHYEVSNFALPGRESKHNGAYWTREPYLGLGAGAHSFDGRRTRSWNADDLELYISAWSGGGAGPEAVVSGETLSDEDVFNEGVMLSLRRAEGLDMGAPDGPLPAGFRAALDALVEKGCLLREGSHMRIPEDRWFVSDDIIGGLFL